MGIFVQKALKNMIINRTLTIEDFNLFQERMWDFGLFEFIDKQIVPVQGTEPVEADLVAYVLSPDFDENEVKISFPMPTKNTTGLFPTSTFICGWLSETKTILSTPKAPIFSLPPSRKPTSPILCWLARKPNSEKIITF